MSAPTQPNPSTDPSAAPVPANPYADASGAPMPPQQPDGQPAPMPMGGPVCRFCGSVPAVEATMRGHQGFLVIMKFLKLEGPFCRTCGVAAHREMTAKSLWQGWWGIASSVINPITMLINLPQRAKINKLQPPLPGAPGQPMNPGRPVFRRAAVLGFLVPVIAVALLVLSVKQDPQYANVGDCVHNKNQATVAGVEDTHPDVVVISCSDPSADARIVGKVSDTTDADTACKPFADSDGYFSEEQGSQRFTLCLHFLK